MTVKSMSPIRRTRGVALARDNILYIIESLLAPCIIVFTIWGIAIWDQGDLTPPYFILSLIMFSLTYPSPSRMGNSAWSIIKSSLTNWIILASLVLFLGITTSYIDLFSRNALIAWLILTPLNYLLASLALHTGAPFLLNLQGATKRAVIVGINKQGSAMAVSLTHNPYSRTECVGFFDDRSRDRLPKSVKHPILGSLSDVATYAKEHDIHVIYLALPMSNQPRILSLLDDLKDTTASIYFLPDVFISDIIQGRAGQVDGIPVVAICETPFTGIDGMLKRLSDLAFAAVILILISPILLAISIGVKLSSPGPIIFKQRRYGLDGKEILVYKFRSMTTQDNNSKVVVQATKDDKRITKFGGFLRKTSLDELPQFINVLQGRMSIVGPRPHAVAHNEMYRKVIKGYMIRHKVKPGITGLAQVNGLRGETETLDKMQARVEYDINYLRNWSLRLDTAIILRTVWVVLRGQDGAY